MGMNLQEIEKLVALMRQYDLNELEVKEGGTEFSARRGGVAQPVVVAAPALGAPAVQPVAEALNPALKDITSPIVGTFYRSPSPDQPPFKEIGDRVNADDVICIVEAMKVMNEIKAGISGTLRKVLIDNATPVEFGQPLFQVEVG